MKTHSFAEILIDRIKWALWNNPPGQGLDTYVTYTKENPFYISAGVR